MTKRTWNLVSLLLICASLLLLCGCSATWVGALAAGLPTLLGMVTGIAAFIAALIGKTIPADVSTEMQTITGDVDTEPDQPVPVGARHEPYRADSGHPHRGDREAGIDSERVQHHRSRDTIEIDCNDRPGSRGRASIAGSHSAAYGRCATAQRAGARSVAELPQQPEEGVEQHRFGEDGKPGRRCGARQCETVLMRTGKSGHPAIGPSGRWRPLS